MTEATIALEQAKTGSVRGEAADGADGAEFLRIFARHKLLIAAFVIVFTAVAAMFVVWLPPIYKSSATVMIVSGSDDASSRGAALPNASQDDILVVSQIEQLRSRALARRVGVELALGDDLEFNPAATPGRATDAAARTATAEAISEAVIDNIQRHVAIARVERSNLITIAASSRSPEKAAKIANRFALAYIAWQVDDRLASNRQAIAKLGPRVQALREQVIEADASVAAYRRQHNIIGPADTSDVSQLARLAGSLSDARSNVSESAARAQTTAAPNDGGVSAATSPLLNDLRRQGAELGKHVAELQSFYGPGYPELINAQAQLADINRRTLEETERVAKELRSEVRITRARAGQISSDVAALREQSFRQRGANVRLMDLERNAEAVRSLYVSDLGRLRELGGVSQLIRPPARILTRAVAPTEASFPRPREIIGVAVVGSLLLGLLAAFVVELMDRRVRSADQIERLLAVPTLAMIPKLSKQELAVGFAAPLLEPHSVYSESLRSLFLELGAQLPTEGSGVVLVTSPLPGDGKTTVALGLAVAAAMLGERVAIVDVDFRRPGLLQMSGLAAPEKDLAHYLAGVARLDEVAVQDPRLPGLMMFGVNHAIDTPGMLLSARRIEQLLERLRGGFDLVVLNAPPILAVSDAKALHRYCHATLLVMRWGVTRADVLRTAANSFGGRITGAVINQVDYRRHARLGYGDAIQHHADCSSYYVPSSVRRRARSAV